jgi:hypothetical protein
MYGAVQAKPEPVEGCAKLRFLWLGLIPRLVSNTRFGRSPDLAISRLPFPNTLGSRFLLGKTK